MAMSDFEGRKRQLQQLLDGLASRRKITHAVAAVASGDGRFSWSGAAGERTPSGPPMQPGTPFHTASVDKMLTTCIVLKLVERGRLALDRPMTSYLPGDLVEGIHRLDGVDHTGRITIANLLGHTSGLPDCYEERPRGGRSLMDRVGEDEDFGWTIDELIRIVREELRPHFVPQPEGTSRPRIRYSDTNFQLLIAIVETVTSKPLHQLFEEELFRPLGMTQSWMEGRSEPLEPAPAPAAVTIGQRPLDLPLALRSFPSVYSTTGDMIRFMKALVRGALFDDSGTTGLMTGRWKRFGFPLDLAALRAPSWPIEYGLGIMRFRLPRLFTPFHPVPEVIGHSGSTGSWLFHAPDLDLFLCGTVDEVTSGAVPYRLVPKMLKICG
jgi:D-alanyl-D-alanine carboxypeptidase